MGNVEDPAFYYKSLFQNALDNDSPICKRRSLWPGDFVQPALGLVQVSAAVGGPSESLPR